MKLECGKRKRLRQERKQERDKQLRQPHLWFAWRPVKVGDEDCRWLEHVTRRRVQSSYGDMFGDTFYYDKWEYSAPPGPPPVLASIASALMPMALV